MSENINRLKRAIEQIDEAQPLCPSPGCDCLSDAAMNIDLVVSEIEAAESKPNSGPDDLPVIDSFSEGDPSKPEPGEFTTRSKRKELRRKYPTCYMNTAEWPLLDLIDSLQEQVRQLEELGAKSGAAFLAKDEEIHRLQEQLKGYKERINKMKVGSLSPETRLNGYKVCVEAMQKRKEELFKQLAAKQKELENAAKICTDQANEIVARDKEITIQAEQIELIENQCQKNGRDAADRQAEIERLQKVVFDAGNILHNLHVHNAKLSEIDEEIEKAWDILDKNQLSKP